MLGGTWLFLSIVLLILAVIMKQASLLAIVIPFFLTLGIARFWSRYAFQKVFYERRLSTNRIFFGENVTLDLSITNNKFLPLPWLHIEEEIPEEVTFLKGKNYISDSSPKPMRSVLSFFLSIGWYHRLTRRFPLKCMKRGLFYFGPATINSGDPFSFYRSNITTENQDQLLVYPCILTMEELGLPSQHPFGDLRLRRHLFEDPVQVMTTRDYVSGDPLKRIHWKSSARLQQLQTRVFEHTTTSDMSLFLDTRTVTDKYYWGVKIQDLLETAVITAASIANYGIKEDYKVGFYANESYWDSHRLMKLPPSNHPNQLEEILGALANIKGVPRLTIEKLLITEARNLSWATTLVLITSVLTDDITASLKTLKRAGRRVVLILIGVGDLTIRENGLLTYQVSEEIYRNNLDTVSLRQDRKNVTSTRKRH